MTEIVNLDVFKMILENVTTLIFIAGVICFAVSVITQITKNLPGIRRIPTDLQVLVLCIAATICTYFAYVQIAQFPVTWYFIIGMIVLGFVLALVTTKGWNYVVDIFKKFQYKGGTGDVKQK